MVKLSSIRALAAATIACLTLGCGAGQYGYARTYVPLSDEDEFLEGSTRVTHEDVRRSPREHTSTMVAWFGTVNDVRDNNGIAWVSLTHRVHMKRHLCADETSSSCRVTVSDREGGEFSTSLRLHDEDVGGENRLAPGSLVRVYGNPTGELDDEGGPIIRAKYYRHWPHGTYVTTADANHMRR